MAESAANCRTQMGCIQRVSARKRREHRRGRYVQYKTRCVLERREAVAGAAVIGDTGISPEPIGVSGPEYTTRNRGAAHPPSRACHCIDHRVAYQP